MNRPAHIDELPPPLPETVRQRSAYWAYRSVWEAVAHMPERTARKMPRRLGRTWYLSARTQQRSQARANMARITGLSGNALERIVRDAYISYARYWVDSFRLHTMDPADVLARSTEENMTDVDDLLAGGEGAIVATAHLGSWDIGAFFTTQRNWGMTVVAELLEPRRLFERFVWLRQQAGIDVIPLVRGGDMVGRLEEVVAKGKLATLLADRDLGKKGPIVEFFGEPCRLPAGTAVLARRTGRPVAVGAFVTEGDDRYRAVITNVVDISHLSVEDGTQVIARELETLIGRYPEQWHVFVPNWLADREPDHPMLHEHGETSAT